MFTIRLIPVALFAFLGIVPAGWAYTPESAEVKSLVKRGLDFLERGAAGGPVAIAGGGGATVPSAGGARLGEVVLKALAFYKSGKPEHRLIKEAVDAVYRQTDWPSVDNYSLGLSLILLAELNDHDQKHLPMIQKLVDEMISHQQKGGGIGYSLLTNLGDISQTQYAALGFWNARMAGAKVPQEAIEKVCAFLIRNQDPGGGWSYNGFEANGGPTSATYVKHSLSAAGLGSVCVCADLLGINRRKNNDPEQEETGLPSALKVVKKPKAEVEAAPATSIDPEAVERSVQLGQRWFAQNYKIDAGQWNYYYLYGLERCESYREHYYGKYTKEPKWYNDGVQWLSQKIQADGSWPAEHSSEVSTAFAILFLQRSSQKAIIMHHKDLGDGVLSSGKGLPTDLSQASVKRGKVVDSPLAAGVDDLVEMLNNPENPELARLLDSNEDVKLDPDLTKRSSQIVKLRESVRAGSWEARMVAVKGLGKGRELDSVPCLLYALTDPDVRVVLEADDALRFISRKFQGVGLPRAAELTEDKRPTDHYRKAISDARAAWRNWYLSIRPDAELID
jgi:hypothetical protein